MLEVLRIFKLAAPAALALKTMVAIKAWVELVLRPGFVTPPVKEISPVVLLKYSSAQLVINEPVLLRLTTSTKSLGKVIFAFQRLALSISLRLWTLTENCCPAVTEVGASRVKEVSGVVDAGEEDGEGEACVELKVTVVGVKALATLLPLSSIATIAV